MGSRLEQAGDASTTGAGASITIESMALPILTIVVTGYSSGMPNRYEVVGMPNGETVIIRLTVLGSVEKWRIRRGNGRFRGAHESAEHAFAELQAQVDAERRAISEPNAIGMANGDTR